MNQSQQKQQYLKIYEEHNLLGRGNYGSAFLVKNNIDSEFYVAKKMMLEGMPQKEIALAWGEIEILKKVTELRNPFIVQYKESFHFDNTLIIVMEYCQHGDLSVFLKNWKKKGEFLDERVIIHWFIQLVYGVKSLHSKNVLHRDLKSANVFLTSNKTLKIGDFGISKVLDNTSAKTFVGTPYYLSPQVCQNRPYNLASDLWSLGCILYELCTLTYPFQAGNLLGLAMKILTDEVKPISPTFSPQLNGIVMGLFTKSQKQRITIDQILRLPFILQHIKTFAEDQQTIRKLIPIGKRNLKAQQQQPAHEQTKKPISAQQQTMKTINSVMQNTGNKDTLAYSQSLTPKQRMKLKKQQQIRKQQQLQIQAIKKNASMKNYAKQKKNQILGTSGNKFNSNNSSFSTTNNNNSNFNYESTINTSNPSLTINTINSNYNFTQNLEKSIQNENLKNAQLKKATQKLENLQVINTEELCFTLNKLKSIKGVDINFQENEEVRTLQRDFTKKCYVDERPIKPSKNLQYNIQQQQSYDYNNDDYMEDYLEEGFEDYIEEESHLKQSRKEQFEDIKAFYDNEIGHGSISPTKKSRIIQAFKPQTIKTASKPTDKIGQKIEQCVELIGRKKYNELYTKVKKHEIEYKNMKKLFNQNQTQAIKLIDQIIYYESF